MNYNQYSIIDQTFQLNGDSIPSVMKVQLYKEKGSEMDLKCCHCTVFHGERKSLEGEVSNL